MVFRTVEFMGTQGETCDSPDAILSRVVSDRFSLQVFLRSHRELEHFVFLHVSLSSRQDWACTALLDDDAFLHTCKHAERSVLRPIDWILSDGASATDGLDD